jgi:quinol monooxygenase YgiN
VADGHKWLPRRRHPVALLPEAQREPGAKMFLVSHARENPTQFLFYELSRDEAACKGASGERVFQDLYRR